MTPYEKTLNDQIELSKLRQEVQVLTEIMEKQDKVIADLQKENVRLRALHLHYYDAMGKAGNKAVENAQWVKEVSEVANKVFDLDGCCHWETVCEAIEQMQKENLQLRMDSANYRAACGWCGTRCMDMLTDHHCAACGDGGMVMQTEYRVVEAGSLDRLTEIVNNHLSQGWEVTGGVCFSSYPVWIQAMVKHSPRKWTEEEIEQITKEGQEMHEKFGGEE